MVKERGGGMDTNEYSAKKVLPYRESIFDPDGNLWPLKEEFFGRQKNKICAKNIVLSHYINDHPDIGEDVKKEILKALDSIYFDGKRMHHRLCRYKNEK